jgi:hypothetical protein
MARRAVRLAGLPQRKDSGKGKAVQIGRGPATVMGLQKPAAR